MLNTTSVTPQEILQQISELENMILEYDSHFAESHNDVAGIHLYVERYDMPAGYSDNYFTYEMWDNGYGISGSIFEIEEYMEIFWKWDIVESIA